MPAVPARLYGGGAAGFTGCFDGGVSMKTVRKFDLCGFRFTLCGTAIVDGERVGYDVDVDERSVVVAGDTSDQRAVNAFFAGIDMGKAMASERLTHEHED